MLDPWLKKMENEKSRKRVKKLQREYEKELDELIGSGLPLFENMHVTVGSTVTMEDGYIPLGGIPLELMDLVVEFRAWEDKVVCHRGIGKANNYWHQYRQRFTDRRIVVPVPAIPDFKGNLRPYQNEGVKVGLLTEEGIFQLPTGSGKTVMGMALIAALKQRALWVVHNTMLLNQAANSVRKFLGIEPGIIGGGTTTKLNSAVVVATMQSLAPRIQEIREAFGLVVFDEAHHLAADSLLDVCAVLPARYRFGMTATARRRDNRDKILPLIIGPKITSPSTLSMASYLAFPTVHFVHTGFDFPQKEWTELLAAIRDNAERNAVIAVLAIEEAMKAERVLILTRLVEHVNRLGERLIQASKVLGKNHGINYKKGFYSLTGASAPAVREAVLDGFRSYGGILVATEELCGEGFDLPQLDSLILTMPAGEIRGHQRAGRLMRLFKAEQDKKIYDFVDYGQIPEDLAERRKNEYLSMGLVIGEDIHAE